MDDQAQAFSFEICIDQIWQTVSECTQPDQGSSDNHAIPEHITSEIEHELWRRAELQIQRDILEAKKGKLTKEIAQLQDCIQLEDRRLAASTIRYVPEPFSKQALSSGFLSSGEEIRKFRERLVRAVHDEPELLSIVRELRDKKAFLTQYTLQWYVDHVTDSRR